jgi:flagellin
MASVNTNYSALVATQVLAKTNRDLADVQGRISTGLKVASAKDDAATYGIAQGQRARIGGLNAISTGIDRGSNILSITQVAGAAISETLVKLVEKARALEGGGLSTDQQNAYIAEYTALQNSIATSVASATFNGSNLIAATGANVTVNVNDATTGNTLVLTSVALTAAGLSIATTITAANAAAQRALVETAITTVSTALGTFGAQANILEDQKAFIDSLADVVEKGVGQLVDADLAKESARLQSLQVKQQLGAQALSVANQTPQVILSFFQ